MQGVDQVPAKYTSARASFCEHHTPDAGWTIETWDEARGEEILRQVAPDFGQTPEGLVAWYKAVPKLIQRCDILRCFVLYARGGVYVDMDCISLQPLTPLLDAVEASCDERGTSNAFVFCETINNAVFASSARNPIFPDAWWPEVFDAVSNGRHRMGWLARTLSLWGPGLDVIFTTGPMMWGRVLDGTGTVLFGGTMTDAQKNEWGVYRPPHNAFYPRMDDAGRLATLTDRVKAQMVSSGSYTYHAQESDWLSGGVSVSGCFMAMTRAQTRLTVLVSALLVCAVLIAAIVALQIVWKSASTKSVQLNTQTLQTLEGGYEGFTYGGQQGQKQQGQGQGPKLPRTVHWKI
jgi:hypothetical protein